MVSQWNMKMQRLILLTLIPALSAITLLSGVWLYRSLYNVILEGFDRKLYALSTTTASFIDGEELLTVLDHYQVSGLAFDAANETLYGIDTLQHALVHIDTELGGAAMIGTIGHPVAGDLALDPDAAVLYAVSPSPARLIRIDPETGSGEALLELEMEAPSALVWSAEQKRLLAATVDALWSIDPATGETTELLALSVDDITGLARDPKSGTLFGLRGPNGMLITIDLITGEIADVGLLIPEGHAFGEVEYGEEAGELPAYGLAWNSADSVLYATSDRLMVVDPETGVAELELWLSRNWCNPASDTYARFAEPMHHILEDKDITYLYTFLLGGRKDIVYIVDASPDDGWCPIGYEEEVPPQNAAGVKRAIEDGVPFISDVLDFELWGLLKVAAAPIYDQQGNIRALTGVDINIDLIRTKTRVALFQVLGFGVVSLVLAGMVSVWVTRQLIRPINELKYGALRIAAGQYEYPLQVRNPRELRDLSDALNGIGATLQRTISDMGQVSRRMELGRCRTELMKSIAQSMPSILAEDDDEDAVSARWLGNRPVCVDASGAIRRGSLALGWIEPRTGDPLDALKRRSDHHHLLKTLIGRSADMDTLAERIGPYLQGAVTAYWWGNADTGEWHVWTNQPLTAVRIAPNQDAETFTLEAGRLHHQDSPRGSSWALCTTDPDSAWIKQMDGVRFQEDVTGHAGRLADRLENRLQSHTPTMTGTRSGLLVVLTRRRT